MDPNIGTSKKIFVGGLPQNCTEQVLTNYFMQYGTIVDSVVMKDRETGNSRGFGFVTYDSTEAVDMVIRQYEDHRIENKWVEVKRAIARENMPPGGEAAGGKGKGKRDRGAGGGCGGGGGRDRSGFAGGCGGERSRPGDWTCSKCNANVFASKEECYKCGTRKGGLVGGQDYRGMPSPLGGGGPPPMAAGPPLGPYGGYAPPCNYGYSYGGAYPASGPTAGYGAPPPCGGGMPCGGPPPACGPCSYPYDPSAAYQLPPHGSPPQACYGYRNSV